MNMGRRLTQKEIEARILKKIDKRIKAIAKVYGSIATRIACRRYNERIVSETKLKQEIRDKEKQLEDLKKEAGR